MKRLQVMKTNLDEPMSSTEVNMQMSTVLGEIVTLLMMDQARSNLTINDVQQCFVPPVVLKRSHLIRNLDEATGQRKPFAAAFWTWVTPEVGVEMRKGLKRLKQEDWNAIPAEDPQAELWVVDILAPFGQMDVVINMLKTGPLKGKPFKFCLLNRNGEAETREFNGANDIVSH